MGYYRPQGDWYQGYRGDPGIGSFFKGLVSKAVSFIPGVGPIISTGIDALGKVMPGGAKTAGKAAAGAITAAAGGVASQIVKHPVLTAAGAAGALGGAMLGGAEMRGPAMTTRSHKPVLRKCGMPLKHGGIGKCHRSMNVCNPRALRKAIRRTRGFAKLAMKTIHIVHPKKKGRFGGFKRRKRS